MTNDWGDDDMVETITHNSEPELTPRQKELRDGIAAPHPFEGAARQRRIDRMQANMNACADLVSELDRIAEHLHENPPPCVNELAFKLVLGYIANTRQQALDKGRQLRQESAYLRGIT